MPTMPSELLPCPSCNLIRYPCQLKPASAAFAAFRFGHPPKTARNGAPHLPAFGKYVQVVP
jgi:hypothetical protein